MAKKKFTVSIGEKGTLVTLHHGHSIESKIIISELTDSHRTHLEDIFNKNKEAPIYVLIDTIDQNYQRKIYPLVNQFDLSKIVKRDLKKELSTGQTALQSYFSNRNKETKKWECVFVSVGKSIEIEKWIKFLLSLNNRLMGIYMLPIELQTLAMQIFDNFAKNDLEIKDTKNLIISFIIQNKISGVRQVVFSGQSIIFTRLVNYDFNHKLFPKQFEEDIFRSNEYLRTILPNTNIDNLVTINALSQKIINKIEHIKQQQPHFISYSPSDISQKLGIKKAVKKDGEFSDVIIANSFANNNKKILRFTNPKIIFLDKIYVTIKSFVITNIIFLILVLAILARTGMHIDQSNQDIKSTKSEERSLKKKLKDINKAALEGNNSDKGEDLASIIIDFGKVDEIMIPNKDKVYNILANLSLIKNHGARLTDFSYKIVKYDYKGINLNKGSLAEASGEISDTSGDVEVLLKKFDLMSLETKRAIDNFTVKYSGVSKNIDFGKEYFSFPFQLKMDEKIDKITKK